LATMANAHIKRLQNEESRKIRVPVMNSDKNLIHCVVITLPIEIVMGVTIGSRRTDHISSRLDKF
jgi:hypothetical protein